MQPSTIYEHPAWQELPEQAMRPGGMTVTEQALTFCELPPGARLLDLGCGAGATLRHLSAQFGLVGFGVDISMALLGQAQRGHTGTAYAQARSEQLPLASESMHAVISECTLSIFEMDAALAECTRVLKPGGYFIASDVYVRNESGVAALRQLPAGTCISTARPRGEIEAKLTGCGLEIATWQDCSQRLKEFPMCTLPAAAKMDPLDMLIAAGKAKLGYYFLVAQK